jgi:radical SAM superfamily enzyme YgiQ (UPF0313 family)
VKVLLVSTNRERSPYPVAPLGALCVTAAARAARHQVAFLDLGFAAAPQAALQKALARDHYQAVAFSIRNLDNCFVLAPRSYFDDVRRLAETARRGFRGPLILGGSGFSVAPQGWMRRLDADYGVVGEGERAFVQLLGQLEIGLAQGELDGVITQRMPASGRMATCSSACNPPAAAWSPVSPKVSQAPEKKGGTLASVSQELDDLAKPAHEYCHYRKYLRRGGSVSVQTKRGCPYGCVYCTYPKLEGRRYRLRKPEAVADEIEAVVVQSGSRHFYFVDSVFNDPRAHALAVCHELGRRRLPMRWMAFCNPVGFDAEVARAMTQAGCEGLEFGLDAATPKMLAALRKPFERKEIQTALEAAHGAGLPFAVHLLFGGPGETWADVEEAQTFLNGCAPANSIFAAFGIRVYEGTAIAGIAAQEGLLGPEPDLFEPVYYVSPALAKDADVKLDRIARRRPEWTSPVDWRRPLMRWTQKVMNLLDVRPQWKDIRGYGLHMRRALK